MLTSLLAVPEIGLFPLELVLLPTEKVPLHVFEPRYKELIGECLAESRDFGLVLADAEGLREVGTRAAVVEVARVYEDGRLDIVVEGGERFRVLEMTSGRSFQTADVEALPDEEDEPPKPADATRARELFGELAQVAEADIDPPADDAEALSFEIAARVDFGAELKQELLELRSERARLTRLVELLERALGALRLEREVRDRASGNGRVSPR
jgi:Lon protease-like protein